MDGWMDKKIKKLMDGWMEKNMKTYGWLDG